MTHGVTKEEEKRNQDFSRKRKKNLEKLPWIITRIKWSTRKIDLSPSHSYKGIQEEVVKEVRTLNKSIIPTKLSGTEYLTDQLFAGFQLILRT
ncbi:hypothetical protein K1719_005740 [Acacia pycnantha]|nr:hypothetical protein K1719_005740 [Acacia pycnantha]